MALHHNNIINCNILPPHTPDKTLIDNTTPQTDVLHSSEEKETLIANTTIRSDVPSFKTMEEVLISNTEGINIEKVETKVVPSLVCGTRIGPVTYNDQSWKSTALHIASTVVSVTTYPLKTRLGIKSALIAGMYYGGAALISTVGLPAVIVTGTVIMLL